MKGKRMSYAIICNARKGENMGIDVLALVDRAKSKQFWWTSDHASLILNYLSRDAAEYCVKRLKKNNARIVAYESAVKLISRQNGLVIEATNAINDDRARSDAELGWDGHKGAF
jgi:hypothetical protein